MYILGVIIKAFKPSAKTYSFKNIWNMEYDKNDGYNMFVEEFGQKMTGFAFIIAVILAYALIIRM